MSVTPRRQHAAAHWCLPLMPRRSRRSNATGFGTNAPTSCRYTRGLGIRPPSEGGFVNALWSYRSPYVTLDSIPPTALKPARARPTVPVFSATIGTFREWNCWANRR